MRILITGSHFTPAIATIEELQKYSDTEIVYVGRKTTREGDSSMSVESQELPKLGVKFRTIITGRLQRHLGLYTILSLLKIPVGFLQAFYIILSEKPDVILSFGGYVAVPLVIAGWLMSIPIIIHEQTLVTGLANKISSYFADKIATSFEGSNGFPKNKVVLTGNPIRKSIIQPKEVKLESGYSKLFKIAKQKKLPIIFVTGGNQGSRIINLAVEENLKKLLTIACVVHQTGDSEYKDYERLKEFGSDYYLVTKWVGDEIGVLLKNTDLVVSRAGINTLLELSYLQKPALVIPLPIHSEQNKNSHFFEKLGLAHVLHQKELVKDNLYKKIKELINDLPQIKNQAKKAKEVVIETAAKRLAIETQLLVK